MSPQAKVDLGAKAEAMLASWPAPSSDDVAWENRAAKIVAAATNSPRASDAELAALSALLAKPALESEPGEVESSTVSAVNARSASGVKAMSQDSNDGSSAKPSIPPASATSSTAKRPSLKELAARASQANAAGSPSIRPPASMPPPAAEAVPQDKPSRASSPSPSIAPPKASIPPPPRPMEAGKEDSGRVDLNAINQAATPAQIAAAEVAKPAAHDLVSDAVGEDKPAAANDTTEGAKVQNISEARAKKSKKKSEAAKTNETVAVAETVPAAAAAKKNDEDGGNGKWVALVAMLAIAAGAFFMLRNKEQPPAPAAVVQPKQEVAQPAVDTKKIEEPKPASTGLSIDSLPAAEPTESAKAPGPKLAVAPVETAAPPPTPPEPVAPTAVPTATNGGKVGDLASEMAKSVGGSADKPVNADDATPAAGKTGSQTIPEQPSQGAANAAVRPLAVNAKSCVAGADDVSMASVTFSSAGTVSNVNVSGWAAKNGKSDCIKSALKGANVGPFAKPSFTITVPIRP
jgi:hypothetical protein